MDYRSSGLNVSSLSPFDSEVIDEDSPYYCQSLCFGQLPTESSLTVNAGLRLYYMPITGCSFGLNQLNSKVLVNRLTSSSLQAANTEPIADHSAS